MKQYLDLLQHILDTGTRKPNRTGVDTLWTFGNIIEFDMSTGRFPLLTTKKMGCKAIFAELEMFIKGEHSKKFLNERKCHIWDAWANPKKAPYGTDEESKAKMREEDDLGPIYGSQWVNWNGEGINQLRQAIDKLKKDPTDRRLIVTAWNPSQMDQMALPPCHFCFQLASDGEYLNLAWSQRSVDTPVGLPFDIASYGMLLLLICQETGLKPGKLVGFLADTHIYVDQIDAVKEELSREPRKSPIVKVTNTFPGWRIEDWTYTDFELSEYDPYEPIKIPVAV